MTLLNKVVSTAAHLFTGFSKALPVQNLQNGNEK